MKRLNLSVGDRLGVGFAVATTLLAGLVAVSLVLLAGIQERNSRLLETVAPSAALVEQLERTILNRAIATRAYALTREAGDHDEFRRLDADVRRLFADASRIPQKLPELPALEPLEEHELSYEHAAEALAAAIQRGAEPSEVSALESVLERRRKTLLEPVARLRAELIDVRHRARLEVARAVETERRVLWLASAAVMMVLVATGLIVTQSIRRPVTRLAAASRALSKGEFADAIRLADAQSGSAQSVRDELTQLSLDFGQMARALSDATETLRNQNEELQIQREEIQAQNEEIQAQNEEIQAQNEELHAQNEELQAQGEELRTTLDALSASEERFRRAVTSAPFPVMLHDHEGRVLALSASWTDATGFGHDEIPTVEEWVRRASRHERERERELQFGLGAIEHRTLEGEYPVRTKTGSELIWRLGSAPLGEIAGKHVVISMAVDVTAQKNAEALLREADARKDEFLAMLSHELRNPLTPIRNGLVLLGRARHASEEAERARAIVDRQVAHLTRLVDDLLDVTRITAGKIRLQRETLDLTDVLRKAAEDCAVLFSASEVEFCVALPSERVWVDGDSVRIAQIVGNLLQNAAKFTPQGKVELSLEKDGERSAAIIRVADTGLGIEPAMRARLFEPFAQGERTLARSRGGLGLGLALVKALVELHGGGIELRSAGTNQGTEFRIELPLLEGAAVSESAPAVPASRPLRIVVIEDNQDAADSLAELLTLQGHDVSVAYDGSQGLQKARELLPDVVLCDVGLPGKDGYTVARELRTTPELEATLLVAITGYALEEDRQKALKSGFHAHLAKPIELRQLEKLLAAPGAPQA